MGMNNIASRVQKQEPQMETEVHTPKTTPNAHMYCTKKPRGSHWGPSQKSGVSGSGSFGMGSVDTSNPSGSPSHSAGSSSMAGGGGSVTLPPPRFLPPRSSRRRCVRDETPPRRASATCRAARRPAGGRSAGTAPAETAQRRTAAVPNGVGEVRRDMRLEMAG
jgi:hypothetical protein